MKVYVRFSICIGLFLIFALVSSGQAFSGSGKLTTEWYQFERDSLTHSRLYQSLRSQLSLYNQGYKSVGFTTYIRYTTDFSNKYSSDPQLFVYNGYFTFTNQLPNTHMNAGRKFVYSIAGSALMDGVSFTSALTRNVELSAFGGSQVNRLEPDKIQNLADYLTVGTQLRWRISPKITSVIAWNLKKQNELTDYNQVRTAVTYRYQHGTLYGRIGYNPTIKKVSGYLTRANYRKDLWYLSAEYTRRAPVVSLNSVFALIDYSKFDRIRFELQRSFASTLKLFVQTRYTMFEDDNALSGTVGIRRGAFNIAYNFTDGRGLERNGLSGSGAYMFNRNTSIYGSLSIHRYKIQEEYTELSDAYSTAVGIQRRFSGEWQIQGELQYLRNAVEANSSRIYLRLEKRFSLK